MKKTGKKGATIAELCVVLALVAIIGAMVASFSVMLSRQTRLSTARLNAMNDMEAVETIAENWLGQMKLLDAELSLPTQTVFSEIHAETETGTYTLFFDMDEGVLTGTLPGGKSMTYVSTHIKGMEFDQVVGSSTTERLFFCKVIYELPALGSNKEVQREPQVFFLNPHVGDPYPAS